VLCCIVLCNVVLCCTALSKFSWVALMLLQLRNAVICISTDITLSATLPYPTAVKSRHSLSLFISLSFFPSVPPSYFINYHNTSTSTSTSVFQVVSSSSLPSYLKNTFSSQRVPGSSIPYSADLSVALIISFPSKFPSQGSPSFTIRGSGVSYFLPDELLHCSRYCEMLFFVLFFR
jgi:hypothetical protein